MLFEVNRCITHMTQYENRIIEKFSSVISWPVHKIDIYTGYEVYYVVTTYNVQVLRKRFYSVFLDDTKKKNLTFCTITRRRRRLRRRSQYIASGEKKIGKK